MQSLRGSSLRLRTWDSAGATVMAAGDACRASTGSADCDSRLAGFAVITDGASGFTVAPATGDGLSQAIMVG